MRPFFIHDNQFTGTGTGSGTQGIYFLNGPEQAWIQARLFSNIIETPNNAGEGIGAYNLRGALLANNTLKGSGDDAIGLWGSTLLRSSVTTSVASSRTPAPVWPRSTSIRPNTTTWSSARIPSIQC